MQQGDDKGVLIMFLIAVKVDEKPPNNPKRIKNQQYTLSTILSFLEMKKQLNGKCKGLMRNLT